MTSGLRSAAFGLNACRPVSTEHFLDVFAGLPKRRDAAVAINVARTGIVGRYRKLQRIAAARISIDHLPQVLGACLDVLLAVAHVVPEFLARLGHHLHITDRALGRHGAMLKARLRGNHAHYECRVDIVLFRCVFGYRLYPCTPPMGAGMVNSGSGCRGRQVPRDGHKCRNTANDE